MVSASFEAYVTPVANALGIDEVIATRWEVDPATDTLTGRLDGLNVRGEAKVTLLDDLLGGRCDLAYAYGNSGGDTAMLARARNPVRVGRRPLPTLAGSGRPTSPCLTGSSGGCHRDGAIGPGPRSRG